MDKNNYWFVYPDPNEELPRPDGSFAGVCGDQLTKTKPIIKLIFLNLKEYYKIKYSLKSYWYKLKYGFNNF